MSSRKQFSVRPGDVPPGIVIGLLAYLAAIFIPIVLVTPDLPSTLPSMTFDANAIVRLHTSSSRSPSPAFVDESFEALGRAAALHDRVTLANAQHDFAAMVLDATSDGSADRLAIRNHQLQLFLTAFERGTSDSIVSIAIRHQLVGRDRAPGISRAMLISWFDFRWESLAARETLRGETISLTTMMGRIPGPERRAMIAWVVQSDCDALLALRLHAELDSAQALQCANIRQEFVGMARFIDASYPVDEARAAVDSMLGSDLELAATRTADPSVRESDLASAREAFGRAHTIYSLLADNTPTRRLRRFIEGTFAHIGF